MTRRLLISGATVVLAALVGLLTVALAQNRTLVFGGVPAAPGELPFQIALMAPGSPYAECGGVLVRADWVLTAGHCVSDGKAGSLIVKAGSVRLDQQSPTQTIRGQPRFAPGFGRNERFPGERKPYFNDLALLQLNSAFPLVRTSIDVVAMVQDPDQEARMLNDRQFVKRVAGWGMMNGQERVVGLRRADVVPVNRAACQAAYGSEHVTNSMLCSGDFQQNHCLGDSGGPFIATLDRTSTLLGIISWGDACGTERPGVHARVLTFRKWVDDCVTGRC